MPGKTFEPIREAAVCRFMKMITLEKLRDCLRDNKFEVTVATGDCGQGAAGDRAHGGDRVGPGRLGGRDFGAESARSLGCGAGRTRTSVRGLRNR